MAKVEHYYTRFREGEFYHIYNRTVDKKLMFKDEEDYAFFLKRLRFFLKDVISIYTYNLLDNHFHLLIKVSDDLTAYKLKNKIPKETDPHLVVSKRFRMFFQSYTLSFNYLHHRCGTLFQTPFKRVLIKDKAYLIHIIYYIHTNAQKHGLVNDFRNWDWSSYHEIISKDNTKIQKEIVEWFGNETGYVSFHSSRTNDFADL